MIRMSILLLALAGPAALAQEIDADGRALAAAFSAADLETLGVCQARISGNDWLVSEFGGWLDREGHSQQAAGIRRAQELGAPLKERFASVRSRAARRAGLGLAPSEAAFMRMLNSFARRAGETDEAAFTRLQPETRLPDDCFTAMKRANWSLVDFEKE